MHSVSKNLSQSSVVLSLDLGGTHLKGGVVSSAGKLLYSNTFSSFASFSAEAILENLFKAVEHLESYTLSHQKKILGVGLGVPGILDSRRGIVYRSPHFKSFQDFPIRKILQKKIKYPFVIDNDANMAALGEGWKGSAKKNKNYILMTLGTGIGGGIVLNQKLHHGDSGFAAELGHLVIDYNGRACACGGRGCLEMYASATGIRYDLNQIAQQKKFPAAWKKYQASFEKMTPKNLYDLALQNDKLALEIFKNFGKFLGVGIASLANVLDLETCILGGGLSEAFHFFHPSLLKSLQQHTYSTTASRVQIKKAHLGNQAGMIGAAKALIDFL